jgi:hypothetical protein
MPRPAKSLRLRVTRTRPWTRAVAASAKSPSILALPAQQSCPLRHYRSVNRQDAIREYAFEIINGAEELRCASRVTVFQRFGASTLFEECGGAQTQVCIIHCRQPATNVGVASAVKLPQHIFVEQILRHGTVRGDASSGASPSNTPSSAISARVRFKLRVGKGRPRLG